MEETLTCAVCLSLFEEPVTLPVCSHNFCRACVVACLAQGRRPVEQPLPPSHERPRRQEAERGSAASDDADADDVASVCCPLCRKASALPGRDGVAALPLNTTLAEVVKLFKAGGEARPRPAAREAPCEKHPGRLLQLFCRMCCRPACGQCVSEEHQGVFHAVNLIGALYQEEKLNFFSYLKEIRKIDEQLVKEVSSPFSDRNNNELEIIKREFEYIYKTLEMKKKQLLDNLESQKEKRAKEYEIWKKMKDACRKTIEKYLNESEKIVNECDPQHFLEVACNLNHRMKTQIDLIQFSSQYENLPGYKQMHMDTTSVVHSIFALHLTPANLDAFKAGVPSRDGECVVFGNTDKKSEEQKNTQNAFKVSFFV
uniref:tripartite motif-containing 13-like n=1 Tax=Euleptes europaea TaxID=460621 RepID=UPI002541D337|nr:tripartite motif-containing 13-like [Euleptes europaea]